MRKILVLFAHPRFEHSFANRALVNIERQIPSITFHDLYEHYSDFNIDIKYEQQLLLSNDVVIWHHPFYWYSCPPLLKQWIDLVLEYNWAYGSKGEALKGKYILNVITTGGAREAYQTEGRNRFTVREMLAPFDQTATLCKMIYLPPFAVQGTYRLQLEELQHQTSIYKEFLMFLSDRDKDPGQFRHLELFNDLFIQP
jgi:glutathione-regulated potassium-efflux system ancillary protein KefG